MRAPLVLRRYVAGLTSHTWPCVGGPCDGDRVRVSRLAAWTAWSETRVTIVQTVGLSFVRAGTPGEGQIVVGRYAQPHPFAPWLTFEPSVVAPVFAGLYHDHTDPATGWRRDLTPAGWASVLDLLRGKAAV